MKFQLFLGLLLVLFLVSCDPMQTIEIENKSDHTSVVKFFFTGEGYYKFDEFLTKDSLIVNLDSGEVKAFYFGIGTWEVHNSLDSLASRIDRIEVESGKSAEVFDNDYQVESFFRDRLVDDRYRARIIVELE